MRCNAMQPGLCVVQFINVGEGNLETNKLLGWILILRLGWLGLLLREGVR